jgi:hypothetical protein
LLDKTNCSPDETTKPAVVDTLIKQITAAKKKIEILYKDPAECSSDELEMRTHISRPYKRRNHNVGVLTEDEKERYRMLFSPPAHAHSSSSSAMNEFVAFFDRMEGGEHVRVTPVSLPAASCIYSPTLQRSLRGAIATPPAFSLGSYFDQEMEPEHQFSLSTSAGGATESENGTIHSSTCGSVSDNADDSGMEEEDFPASFTGV